VIHGYAPFLYDMHESVRYHDIVDLCTLLFIRSEKISDNENEKDMEERVSTKNTENVEEKIEQDDEEDEEEEEEKVEGDTEILM